MMHEVYLYIYDLSNGLAAQISQQLTGRFFKAIYHTSIVIHGREYFFGGSGVESSLPSQAPYGQPIEKRKVGETEIGPDLWHSFLEDCAEDYGVGKYHLLEHNCNTFSDAALQFLLGQRIDPEIIALPSDFLNTPFGRMLRPQIDAMYAPRPGAQPVTNGNKSTVQTEVPIDGPTSGSHTDRISEAYTFINTPTIQKLFDKLRTQLEDANLSAIQKTTEDIIHGKSVEASSFSRISDYLTKYARTVKTEEIFPGLDLVRILVHHQPFARFLAKQPAVLEAVLSLQYADDEVCANTRVVLLKMLCNALVNVELRRVVVSVLRQQDALELVSNAPLSETAAVREHGIKCIWNLVILADGIDDDFLVASLASVAESRSAGSEVALTKRVIDEIIKGGSEAVQEMAEILELV